MLDSQETLEIASHLKKLEEAKKRHQQVIKYAETFEKLSEDSSVAEMHIEQLCLQKDQNDSLEVAETLKVLEAIVSNERMMSSTGSGSTGILRAPTKTDRKLAIKQSRKYVMEALDRFTE